MIPQTMSITQLREDIFDVVRATKINKQITEIMLHGEVMADLVPHVEKKKFDWDKYEIEVAKAVKHLRKYNWDDVLEVREKTKARRYKGWSM